MNTEFSVEVKLKESQTEPPADLLATANSLLDDQLVSASCVEISRTSGMNDNITDGRFYRIHSVARKVSREEVLAAMPPERRQFEEMMDAHRSKPLAGRVS